MPCVHYLGPSARAHDLTQHATAITRAGGREEGAAARLCVAGEWGQRGGGQDGGACVRGVLCGWVVHAGFYSQLHGPVTWSEGRLTVPHDATAIFGQLRGPAAQVSLRAWVNAEDPVSNETSGSVTSSRGLPPSSAFQTFRWRSWVAWAERNSSTVNSSIRTTKPYSSRSTSTDSGSIPRFGGS